MLKFSNPDDIDKMLRYHRTKDMINLLVYFPRISPIKDLTIIESVDDYKEHKEEVKDLKLVRNDSPINKPTMKSVEVNLLPDNLEEHIKKIKEIDKDGVLVMFNTNCSSTERYDKYAGIGIGVSLGKEVTIDAVSKGFDGREVSKGISVHEMYIIPWESLSTININNFKDYRTYIINNEDYQKSRNERKEFLLSIGIKEKIIDEKVPKLYQEIPDFIWEDIIYNFLKELKSNEELLSESNLTEFAISGHTEGNRYTPWQLFDKSRLSSN